MASVAAARSACEYLGLFFGDGRESISTETKPDSHLFVFLTKNKGRHLKIYTVKRKVVL